MSYHFSANQYDDAYRPKRLQQYTKCHDYQHQPNLREGETIIRSDDRGYLLPGVARSKDSPWGTHFVGTWDLPNALPGPYALNRCARSSESQTRLREEKESADAKIFGKVQPPKPPRVKPAENDPIRRIVPHTDACPEKNCSYFDNDDNASGILRNTGDESERSLNLQPDSKPLSPAMTNDSNRQSPSGSQGSKRHSPGEFGCKTQTPPPIGSVSKPQNPMAYQDKPQSPMTDQNKAQSPMAYQDKPQSPMTYQNKPQSPLAYQDKPQSPMTYQNKPQSPLAYQDKPQSPLTYQNKPQSPMTYQNKPQSPMTYQDKPQSPLTYQDKPQSPMGYQNKPQSPPMTDQDKPQSVAYADQSGHNSSLALAARGDGIHV